MHGVINPIYWLYALRLLCPHTRVWSSATLWVADVRKRLPLWHRNWSPWFCSWARFLDAGRVPGVEVHPLDGIHLTRSAHAALAQALVEVLKT